MTETYVAFDLGERHIGVAVSDPETGFIFPRPTIEIESESTALLAITDLVTALSPTAAIFGLPLTMHGEVGEQAAKVEAFVEKIRPHLPCEVHLVDERLSSLEAHRHSPNSDDHGQAARLILEKYLTRPV